MKNNKNIKKPSENSLTGGDFSVRWGRASDSGSLSENSASPPQEEDAPRVNSASGPGFPSDSPASVSQEEDAPRANSASGPGFPSDSPASVSQEKDAPRAILAGCNTELTPDKYARAIAELRGLAKACGLSVEGTVLQNASQITHATFLGSGKVDELRREVEIKDADIVLFNEALTPMQMRNLEKALDTEVLDRTGLILQIFASRARTREAKLQVESAQLQYMLPRLVGMRASLSRQGGGSGRLSNKGAGEQKLELDRRRIEKRIAELRRELDVVDRERATQRSRRLRTGLTKVALVGYTNAGKSTIMNALLDYCAPPARNTGPAKTGSAAAAPSSPPSGLPDPEDATNSKKVFQADMLFATLDTSVRRIEAPGHLPFLLSDTVGFVNDLPHALVKAFRSTLEEVRYADLLLEVVDFSDPDYREQIDVTAKTLQEIGAGQIPVVYIYNKTDLAIAGISDEDKNRPVPPRIPFRRGEVLYAAAGKGIGIPEILALIDSSLSDEREEATLLIPYTKGKVLQEIRRCGVLLSENYLPEGIQVRARCRKTDLRRIRQILQGDSGT